MCSRGTSPTCVRRVGNDVLQTRAPGYLAVVDPGQLDLDRFEELLTTGSDAARSSETPGRRGPSLRSALELWRGPALADFAYEPFAQAEIARLEELRLTAVERRIEADLALGKDAELIGELEALVARHPLRERPRAQLMLALYRAGRQAEALDAYQQARRALVDELGIDPSPALQDLEKAILRQDPSLALAAAPERTAREAGARARRDHRRPLGGRCNRRAARACRSTRRATGTRADPRRSSSRAPTGSRTPPGARGTTRRVRGSRRADARCCVHDERPG